MNKSSVDDNKTTLFVQVILPLPLESFTYRVPFHLNEVIEIGQMVAVRFGRKAKRLYGGIISSISEDAPKLLISRKLSMYYHWFPWFN